VCLQRPCAQGAGAEELLRALHAADVKNARQLRQAVAAPHVDTVEGAKNNTGGRVGTFLRLILLADS
jgi:hypothetical protein